MVDPYTHLAVSDLLAQFFAALDDKDWARARAGLCPKVVSESGTIDADRWIVRCSCALDSLETMHDFSNLRIDANAAAQSAVAVCNVVRHRAATDRGGAMDAAYARYEFGLTRVDGAWRIARIMESARLRSGENADGSALARTIMAVLESEHRPG